MKILPQRLHDGLRLAHGWFDVVRSGFWFVDIPRTSSSSIRAELAQRFGIAHGKRNIKNRCYATEQVFGDHKTASEMRDDLGHAVWKRLFTFSIVRNPWDRMHSYYHLQLANGFIPEDWSFRDFVMALKVATEDDENFAFGFNRYGAADFVLDKNGELLVDFVVRYENRDHDLRYVAERIGFKELGRVRTQAATPSGHHYSGFYGNETQEVIATLYAQEIAFFGYSFETSAGSSNSR